MNGNEKKITRRGTAMAVAYMGIALAVAVFSYNCIALSRVPTGSMENAIIPGDYVVGNRLAYVKRAPQAGDIIMFDKDGTFFCKRVVAVAGDEVEFHDGYLYKNGERADEPYLKDPEVETNSAKTFTVPADSCLVLGDNRENSYDARYWDDPYVRYDGISAKVMAVVPAHYVLPVSEEDAVADMAQNPFFGTPYMK